jgi:hypothetical protein
MFIFIYKKSTKHILSFRSDTTTPAPASPEYWMALYIKDNNISAADAQDLTFVETAYVEINLGTNQYKWNELTQQVEADPSYVAPTPTPRPDPTPTV